MTVLRIATLLAAVGLLAGCSSQGGGGPTEEGYTLLQEVNELLHTSGATGRSPGKLADLNAHQQMFPRAYAAIKSGEVVVLWGTPLKGEGQTGKDEEVLAYQKEVPAQGGYVLLSAGTVKKMSASEFQSAPKAK